MAEPSPLGRSSADDEYDRGKIIATGVPQTPNTGAEATAQAVRNPMRGGSNGAAGSS